MHSSVIRVCTRHKDRPKTKTVELSGLYKEWSIVTFVDQRLC